MSAPKYNRTKLITLSAVLCALVFVATAYLPRIPIPGGMGYVHIGDAFIYLAATILPLPYSFAVGAIGAGLADITTGFAIYAPATFIIKAAYAPLFTAKKNKLLCTRNAAALIPCSVICVFGYYLWEVIIYKSFATPLANLTFNLAQAAVSAVIFIIMAFLFDRFKLAQQISH